MFQTQDFSLMSYLHKVIMLLWAQWKTLCYQLCYQLKQLITWHSLAFKDITAIAKEERKYLLSLQMHKIDEVVFYRDSIEIGSRCLNICMRKTILFEVSFLFLFFLVFFPIYILSREVSYF